MTQGHRLREGLLGMQVPGAVKLVTPAQVLDLGFMAQKYGYSAVGRPTWMSKHRDDIKAAVLMPIGVKRVDQGGESVLRCYVGAVAERLGLFVFTLDVQQATYVALPDIDDPWELAEMFLYWSPHLPVDEQMPAD